MHHSAHHLVIGLGIPNMQMVFNAPYSPMINPIETYFSVHKRLVRKLMPVNSKDLLIKIYQCLENINFTIIVNIINHVLSLEESINKLELI